MRAADRTLLEWLGEEGLAAVLKSSLDKNSLVRLANARRVTVAGMRNQSVPADRLARLLAEKFARDEASRRPLMSALDTANRRLMEEWRQLPEEEARARVADDKITGAAAGRLLYAVARERRDTAAVEQARAIAARCRPPKREEPAADPDAATSQPAAAEGFAKERDELHERLRQAEESIEKSRRREKQALQELAQRKFDLNNLKLQFARGKQDQERVEKELRTLQQKIEETSARRRPGLSEELSSRLNQIQDLNRKLAASIERLVTRLPKDEKRSESSAPLVKALEGLREDWKTQRDGTRQATERSAKTLAHLSHEMTALREQVAALKASPRKPSRSRAERPRDGLERTGLFVDVQNVFYGARQQNARLDFEALLQTVSRGRKLIRATAYVVESREIDQSAFISLLQQKGYEVRRKPLKVRADGSFKGDWDMEIALDVLDFAEALDVLILATGDGDFTSLVARVKSLGVEVEVYSFPRNTAKELREMATRFIPIDRRLLIKQPKEAPVPEPIEEADR